ncbi:hypothetical protein N8207_03710 [Planktomarina temperata]|jgi:hypothetical protein|nr:hypothetical protein [Planktomarina temperata]MDA9939295.1 hypothetical protein [Planktomarina temperata]MDC1339559.1 hypothetical protein [Planktomarina temperata]MDC1527050.1 hypothetical protein [Planktomarina temperata]
MSPRLEHFLMEKRILLSTDWAELNNWNAETTKAKFARREVPKFTRVKNLKIITYDDAAEYLLEHGDKVIASNVGKLVAAADLLGVGRK